MQHVTNHLGPNGAFGFVSKKEKHVWNTSQDFGSGDFIGYWGEPVQSVDRSCIENHRGTDFQV